MSESEERIVGSQRENIRITGNYPLTPIMMSEKRGFWIIEDSNSILILTLIQIQFNSIFKSCEFDYGEQCFWDLHILEITL